MAFPVERFFSNVFEHRLINNQPVEVRVDPRVLGSIKVKSPGGLRVLFKSSFSFKVPDSYIPKPPVAGCRKLFWYINFSLYYFKYAIKL